MAALFAAYAIWQGMVYRDVYQFLDRDSGAQAIGAPADHAKVTILAFVDYPTEQSRALNPVVMQALHDQPDLRVIFHPLPQDAALSRRAGLIALAAAKQGAFEGMHDELMRLNRPITDDIVREIAARLKIDADRLLSDSDSDEVKKTQFKIAVMAHKLKVYATPSFVMNRKGMYIPSTGYPTISQFNALITQARKF